MEKPWWLKFGCDVGIEMNSVAVGFSVASMSIQFGGDVFVCEQLWAMREDLA